jgi:probable phosphoglycerate mutase
MKNIITIQHTQSVHHNTGMVGSWTDWELTDLGREHAENIGRVLSAELEGQSWKIYSSDLIRARQTVEPLAKYMGVEIEYNEKLREMNLGEAVGKTREWVQENTSKDWTRNNFDAQEFRGAETWREFWNRVSDLCRDIVEDDAENIILASHGVTLSIWQQIWLGQEISEFEYVGLPGGVSFLGITEKGRRVIHRWNDSSYMKGAAK